MPSAANAKSEKPASSEATDNTPVRQIMTIIEHKIRNLEKRKGKLTQYRDLQKAGKELNSDQRVAVAKYDEVIQTLDFARDLSKQIASIAVAAERDAKKQAKKDAWVRSAMETSKIREVLLILDCLMQMGNHEARDDFLNGSNGAAKLTEQDLKILDDLYPEVTPKHEPNEEGKPAFFTQSTKAAEHLCSIIDGRPKEILGTTYLRIKEIVSTVHECGYFDRAAAEPEPEAEEAPPAAEPQEAAPAPAPDAPVYGGAPLPVPPAPGVVPAPAYPLRPLPPITLQEVEHAYFAQQYPQQRPLAEVIGSQNFFFLQESEIDSPVGTPQPPAVPTQPSPPGPIPTQTFTNQHFIQLQPGRAPEPLPPHYPHPEHAAYPPALALHPAVLPPPHAAPLAAAPPAPHPHPAPAPAPAPAAAPAPAPAPQQDSAPPASPPAENKPDDDWVEAGRSPERDDGDRKTQGQGDGHRFRRGYGRGRGAPNGHRGRGAYQGRQDGYQGRQDGYQGRQDGYRGRHAGDYQPRAQNRHYDGYQSRHNKDSYQSRNDDAYYGNGDGADAHRDENGRERAESAAHGGYKGRGRGGRGPRAAARPPRAVYSNSRRHEHAD